MRPIVFTTVSFLGGVVFTGLFLEVWPIRPAFVSFVAFGLLVVGAVLWLRRQTISPQKGG